MREATRKELEAQRIYAEAARLKAWSHDVLTQGGAQPAQAPVLPGPSVNNDTVADKPVNGTQPDQAQASITEPVPPEAPAKQEQPEEASDLKKPARGVKAAK